MAYVCCAHRGEFCEWSDCHFFRLILFANTTTFVCSLLGSVSRTVFEKVTAARKLEQGWPCFEKINHLPVFHAHYIAIPNSFFYAYCAIVGIFVLVKFFLEKHYILQHYRWLTSYVCAYLSQCFGQGGCYFGCDKTVCLQLHPYNTFFDTFAIK